jgi:hypothetical protein
MAALALTTPALACGGCGLQLGHYYLPAMWVWIKGALVYWVLQMLFQLHKEQIPPSGILRSLLAFGAVVFFGALMFGPVPFVLFILSWFVFSVTRPTRPAIFLDATFVLYLVVSGVLFHRLDRDNWEGKFERLGGSSGYGVLKQLAAEDALPAAELQRLVHSPNERVRRNARAYQRYWQELHPQ